VRIRVVRQELFLTDAFLDVGDAAWLPRQWAGEGDITLNGP
jgi:hypothetical protein